MPLDQVNNATRSGGPIHKFVKENDGIKAVVLDADEIDARDPDGNIRIFPKSGKPMKQYVVKLGKIDKAVSDGTPVEHEGDTCRVFFGGYQAGTFLDAKDAAGGLKLGDILIAKCHNLKKNPKGPIPTKELTIEIRRGTAETIAYATSATAKTLVEADVEEPF